ncbi:MAG: 4-hydroxy-tetrahydrodipicolinate synthase [Verrucomicrobiae bacterium]|nr:4-hydroxy-tetrahydrodipicolinate synthase [Verrucomicrobiae bacterium]MDW8344824.1 4-hydroxy-tetrahydrodipicolinate synthase [Verrucomicrobiae bacterium]
MFSGVFTALVTPFTRSGAVDEARLRDLVESQIAAGVDGLVPCGTTGESPTLSHAEHNHVVELVVKFAAKRCRVIAGTGSNCTDEAIAMTRHARDVGADASLQVAPYYNKPTQAGLYAHFVAIADAIPELPMILYNIPGRCGVDIANETIARLRRDRPRQVVGLKEATGNVDRVSQLRMLVDDEFCILSGDDALTLPMMVVGARGVISVASNVAPREMGELVGSALRGDYATAAKHHARLYPLFKDLFIETNPGPVKAALAMRGQIEEVYRLPLVPMAESNRKQLQQTLQRLGLLK